MVALPQNFLKRIKESYLTFQKQTCIAGCLMKTGLCSEACLPKMSLWYRIILSRKQTSPEDSGRSSGIRRSCLNQNLDGGPVSGRAHKRCSRAGRRVRTRRHLAPSGPPLRGSANSRFTKTLLLHRGQNGLPPPPRPKPCSPDALLCP